MTFNFSEGEILLVDKPLEWSSFDVVNKLKWLVKSHEGKKKVKLGHAGTLDPLATGLLILCSGKLTKKISEIQAQEKEYTGEFFLGATTPSYDLETEPENLNDVSHLKSDELHSIAKRMIGEVEQMPPIFSAKKVKGVRAYELARKGKEVELKPNLVHIYNFELTKIDLPIVEFRVRCSKGTYIRSLAHDFGQAAGVGAYLNKLRRTKIGEYSVENAMEIPQWVKALSPQS